MIKKNLRVLIVTSLVILLPILVGLVLWNRLPDQLPTHWNAAGEVDGWSSKAFSVFGIPSILLAFQWVCVAATAADPKHANHSEKILHLVFWIIPVLNVVLNAIAYSAALGKGVRIEVVMPVLMGVLFIIIGNYLPKCKQNYTIGIKIPWTLNDEENWNKTHRFAGRLWVVCGFAITLTGFFGGFWVFLPIVFVMVLIPFLYSYLLHRKGA
ncbi:MAG: SdpI family protein [Clostridia bacterium]|nr:SdpI family protein [Clostridia bacterium]